MPTFPALGDELGGYRIESLIGRGGMSVVYLAEQLVLGRKVALKLLSPELSEDEEFRQRFIRESRLAGGLEHPNIIPVHEAGDVEGLLFIAMRYVQGSDLKALLQREGPLTLERTIDLVSQAASALDAAHARGLVHRDVKPGNLLVASGEGPESSEHIYLSDFGLTKKTDSKSRMTSTGQFVGTLDYVAPEQIQGKEVSKHTDLYSLACVVCECLTGKAPYERDSEVAVMYAHLQDPPPKPSQMRPELPVAVDQVIERAMAKDPAKRYESCRDFMRALREATGTGTDSGPQKQPRLRRRKQAAGDAPSGPRTQPVTPPVVTPVAVPTPAPVDSREITRPDAEVPGAITKPSHQAARRFNAKAAAVVAIPLVALGAFLMTRDTADPGTEKDDEPAVVVDSDPTPDQDDDESASGGDNGLPGRLAFLEETAPGSEQFFVSVAEPPDARPKELAGTTGADWRNRRPDWLPGGSYFVFAKPDADGTLGLVVLDPASPREPLEVLDEEGGQGSASISPDGNLVAFSQTVGTNLDIYLWDRSSGETTRLTTDPGVDDSPEWSSDGTRIVYEHGTGGMNDIYIMDADGTDARAVTNTPNINEKLPEFNPVDDSLIVYHRQESGGDFGIFVRDVDSTPAQAGTRIVDTPAFEMRATWSPDGSSIAYDSDANGNLDIFVIPFEGLGNPPSKNDARQLTDGPHDEQSPAWGGEA